MKKIIRLNEEKLQRLIEKALDEYEMDFSIGDPQKELEELITNILDGIDYKTIERDYKQEGEHFCVTLVINHYGGHYCGDLSVFGYFHGKYEEYAFGRMCTVYLDLTTSKITRHNDVRDKQAYRETIKILNKLGFKFV